MAEEIKILEIKIAHESIDSHTDRRLISGTVMISAVYGETTLTIPIGFDHKSSPDEAAADALRYMEHFGHFIETKSKMARLEYNCGRR